MYDRFIMLGLAIVFLLLLWLECRKSESFKRSTMNPSLLFTEKVTEVAVVEIMETLLRKVKPHQRAQAMQALRGPIYQAVAKALRWRNPSGCRCRFLPPSRN